MKKNILLFTCLISFYSMFSQINKSYSVSYDDIPAQNVLDDIEYRFAIEFIYTKEIVNNITIKLPKKKRNLQQFINDISDVTNLKFTRIDNTHFYVSNLSIEIIEDKKIEKFITKGIHENPNGSYALNLKSIGILPGLIEPDIIESLQQFPNVLSINETASEINVRGGKIDQNNVIWDDIDMYLTGHLFGMVSAFNPYVADKVYFYDKATNAKYGEKISSITDILTDDQISEKAELQVGMNAMSADAVLRVPLIEKKLDLQVSFRHSYEHIFETPTFKKYEDKAFQYTNIQDEKFNFNDYNFKFNAKINNNNSIHFSTIHLDNDLENVRNDSSKTFKDELDIESNGYSSKWLKSWSSKINQKTGFSISKYNLFYDLETIHTPTFSSYLKKLNSIDNLKIFTDLNFHLSKGGLINFGYQYKKQHVSFKIESTKNITYILDQDDNTVNTHSVYSGLTLQKTLNYFIYFGIRANYYETFNLTKIEPRFMVNKNLNSYFKIQLSGEIKNQIISQIDETLLGDYSVENKLWRLANNNNDFPIINAKHISSKLAYTKNKWTVESSLFYKDIIGISSLELGYLNPNNNSFHAGDAIIKGGSIHIEKKFKRINTWINYSFLDAKNKFDGILNNQYFTADTEIKHAFETALTYKKDGFQMAINWKYRSGRPVTVLEYDNSNTAFIEKINSDNLPDFHRMDFSTTYKFSFKKKGNTKGQIGFSIRNVYNNKNIVARVYSGNNSINDPITYVDYKAIGFTPNFMFRVYF